MVRLGNKLTNGQHYKDKFRDSSRGWGDHSTQHVVAVAGHCIVTIDSLRLTGTRASGQRLDTLARAVVLSLDLIRQCNPVDHCAGEYAYVAGSALKHID